MTTRQISTATWAGNLPDNLSYLAPTQFELLVKKLPNTKYFATGVNVPSVTVAEIQQPTNLGRNVLVPGDKINLGELTVTLLLMKTWKTGLSYIHGCLKLLVLQTQKNLEV